MSKEKPKYSMAQNAVYLLKNLWSWEPRVLLLHGARIPAMVLLPLLLVWMPRVVLDGLTRHVTPANFALSVGLTALAIVVCSVWNRWLEGRLTLATMPNRVKYSILMMQKKLTADFQWTESPQGQKAMERALEATGSNPKGAEQMVPTLVGMAAAALGFVVYGAALAALHPLLVAFLIITAAVAFFGRAAGPAL